MEKGANVCILLMGISAFAARCLAPLISEFPSGLRCTSINMHVKEHYLGYDIILTCSVSKDIKMCTTRSKKPVELCIISSSTSSVMLPKWETANSTLSEERDAAIEGKN